MKIQIRNSRKIKEKRYLILYLSFIITEVLNFQLVGKNAHKSHTINNFMVLLKGNQTVRLLLFDVIAAKRNIVSVALSR